jgi:hypothetical protein
VKPIEPEEISGLLDGELTQQRADEVRRAIGEDESLGAIYRRLAAMDKDLKRCAEAAMFEPRVSIADTPTTRGIELAYVTVLLLAARALVKFLPFAVGIGLETVALVLVVSWVIVRLVKAAEPDDREIAQRIAADPG